MNEGAKSSLRNSRHLLVAANVIQRTLIRCQVHLNGYSNGYGSGSDMEITDDLQDVESDVDNLEELPFPPTPPQNVS